MSNDVSDIDEHDEGKPLAKERLSLGMVAVVFAITCVATGLAFAPSSAATPRVLLFVGVPYAVMAVFVGLWLRGRSDGSRLYMPKSGDITLAGLLTVTLYLACILVVAFIEGTPRESWIRRVYLQVGNPAQTVTVTVGASVMLIAALEEWVWRGFVNVRLIDHLGKMRGLLLGTTLYTLAHASTLYLLRDSVAGFNPLIVIAAAGCGLIWGGLSALSGRLGPSIASHALFTWAVVEFPLWRLS